MSIILENVSKVYGEAGNKVNALSKVSLKVCNGDFMAIMGTSGAGKTTLLNIIGCVDTPDTDSYLFQGKEILKCDDKKLSEIRNEHIGFVLQDFGLIAYKTVFENVAVPLLVGKKHYDRAGIRRRVMMVLEKAGIVHLASRKAYQLSGGQKQRVSIARALVNHPDVLLADEPTGNLDRNTTEMIMKQLTKINESGTTVIIVTHDEKVAGYCKCLIRIEDGKVFGTGHEKYKKTETDTES